MLYKIIVISFLTASCGSLAPASRTNVNATDHSSKDNTPAGGKVLQGAKQPLVEQKAGPWWYASMY